MVYLMTFVIMLLIALVIYLFVKVNKYWQLNEYHRGMIQQVREILKEEAKRRERARRRRARGTPREARIAKFQ